MTATIVVVAALLLVPGVGAALALAAPGAVSIESRIALAFGLGYALVAGVAVLLALAHVFSRPTFIAAVVLATLALWAVALRRASPRAHGAALVSQARESPFALAASLGLLLAVAVIWPLQPAALNLGHRPAWRYWADGLEVASAGHVPAQTQQWGMQIPTTVNKVVLNAFEGGVSFVVGPDPLPAMHAILVVIAVGLVAALLALGRELGLRIFAPLVPALVVLAPDRLPLAHEMSNDLRHYTAENVGRMVAFSAVVAGIYALRTRDRRAPAAVAGLLLALAALTHGVPTLVAGVILVFYAVGALLVDRGGARRILARGAAVIAVFGVCYVGVIALSGGDLGFQRAGGAAFEEFPPSIDPTRSFTHGRLLPPPARHGHFLIPPREIFRVYAEHTVNRPGAAWPAVGALAALALATIAIAWRIRLFVPLVVVAWGLLAAILAAALYFSYRYETLIPGVFGVRRLYDYAALVPALLVSTVLEAITALFARRKETVAAVVAVGVGVLTIGAAVALIPRDRPLRSAAGGEAVIDRVAEVIPCDARMLANARTAGTWEATTGRRALTEGMAPFLRPEVLKRVLPVLVGANAFFHDPAAHRDFLAQERVQYLVVVKPRVWFGWGVTGRAPAEGDADAIASLPNVHAVVRDPAVTIFAVGSSAAPAGGVQPRRCLL
jgi:hypothetical protein